MTNAGERYGHVDFAGLRDNCFRRRSAAGNDDFRPLGEKVLGKDFPSPRVKRAVTKVCPKVGRRQPSCSRPPRSAPISVRD